MIDQSTGGANGGAHSKRARNPLQIIDGLELGASVDVAAMADRTCAFKAIDMGERDLPIGSLLDFIRSDAALCPPRSGHIGNWSNIARSQSGAMDFNKAICAPGYGYPLLYCFTQTEVEEPRRGDWGYLPGSFVDGDARTLLQLHAWDGEQFTPCSHAKPRFVPFMQAEIDGRLQPLIELHRQRLPIIGPRKCRLEQAHFSEHADQIRSLLTVLIDDARRRENPRRALQDLFSHSVTLDGTLSRGDLTIDGRGFKLGETYYPSSEALVEHALLTIWAVSAPQKFMAEIASLPPNLPVVSNVLIAVLSGIIETHLPDARNSTPVTKGPLVAHVHWGGRDMAGYPPRRTGYLLEDSKLRSLKRICTALVANFSDVHPLCFVLLPATTFMLCPTSAQPGDAEMLSKLFAVIQDIRGHGASTDPQTEIESLTGRWRELVGSRISTYFMDRFGSRRGGLITGDRGQISEPVEPEGFRRLTFRQASMIVGALYEIRAREVLQS